MDNQSQIEYEYMEISPVLLDLGKMLEDYIYRKVVNIGREAENNIRSKTKTLIFSEIAMKLYRKGGTLTYNDVLEISKKLECDRFFKTAYGILEEKGGIKNGSI